MFQRSYDEVIVLSKPNYDYINGFNRENYDRISLFVPKGGRQAIKAMATMKGVSVNEFIIGLFPRALTATFDRLNELRKVSKED